MPTPCALLKENSMEIIVSFRMICFIIDNRLNNIIKLMPVKLNPLVYLSESHVKLI